MTARIGLLFTMCLLCLRSLSGEGHFDHLPDNAKATLEQCSSKIQLDGEPCTIVAGCVNAITGHFVERDVDLSVPAPVPFEVVRGGKFGERWDSPCYLAELTTNMYDMATARYDRYEPEARVTSRDHNGGMVIYEDLNVGYGRKKKVMSLKVSDEHYKYGLTNTIQGAISARTNLYNSVAHLDPNTNVLEITRPNGAKKQYTLHGNGKHYLVKEPLLNGLEVGFDYTKGVSEFKNDILIPIEKFLKNQNGTKLAFFEMEHREREEFKKAKTLKIKASNNTHVVYHFTNDLSWKEHLDYRLERVVPSNGIPIKYNWGVERSTPTRKVWPEGRYVALRTYKVNNNMVAGSNVYVGDAIGDRRLGRIAAVGAPVGATCKEHTTHSFLYDIRTKGTDPNTTTVIDAAGCRTVYAFDRSSRIHSIYPMANGAPYIVDRSYWGHKGHLRARVLKDQKRVYSCTKYHYDGNFNPTEVTYYGTLTGRRGVDIALDEEGYLTKDDADAYSVKYTYDRNKQKLSEDDGRKIIKFVPDGNFDRNLAQYICDQDGSIKERFFYGYDENGVIDLEIHDDGIGVSVDDLAGITVRHIKRILNSKVLPVGYPLEIRNLYLNIETGEEQLISRETRTYDHRGNNLSTSFYDADDLHAYTIIREYDSRNNLISETDASGRVTTWKYDANNNAIYEKRAGQPATTKQYDFSNRVIAMNVHLDDGTVLTHRYQYDLLSRKTAEISPYGDATRYGYDFLGRMVSSTQSTGEKTHVAYNRLSQPISLTDSAGNMLKIAYNSRHKPLRMEYPNGTVEKWYYTLDGFLEEHVSINGVVTTHEYDYKGRQIRKTIHSPNPEEPDLHHTWTYDAFHLLEETDTTGLTTKYRYDNSGRLFEKELNGLIQRLEYDKLGRHYRTIEQTEEGYISIETKGFDVLNRVIEERREMQDGTLIKRVTFQFDERDQIIETITEGPEIYRIERFGYGQLGEQISHINPNGDETYRIVDYLFHDENGRLVRREQSVDPQGNIIEVHYDIKGQPVRTKLSDSFGTLLKEEITTYDAFGNRTRLEETITTNGKNSRQVVTIWEYDWFGRLKARTDALRTVEQKRSEIYYNNYGQKESVVKPDGTTIHFAYDGFGRLSTVRSSDDTIDYTYYYDERSRLIAVEESTLKTERSYNSRNQLIRETLKNGLSIGYAYDSKDRPTALKLPDGSSVIYRYDASRLLEITRLTPDEERAYNHQYLAYNGDGKPIRMVLAGKAGEVETTHDVMGRVQQINHPLWRSWGKYDSLGNLIELAFDDDHGSDNYHYAYDSQQQLIQEPGRHYQWDSQYNCVIKDGVEQQHNDLNQLLHDGLHEYHYDANGNLIEKNGVLFSYDALDRLTSVETEGERYVYNYDFQNRRVSKECYYNDAGRWCLKERERYLYTGDQEIGACNADDVIKQLRILGVGLAAEIGAAVVLEIEGKSYVPLHNHIGHVSALIDADTGETAATYRYSAFGEEQFEETLGNPWRYASKRKDAETGFVNFGRRYYSPQMMRWLTPDPIDRDGGPNIYAYVMNTPLTSFDAYGLRSLKDDYVGKYDFWGSENLNKSNPLQQLSNMGGRRLLFEAVLTVLDAMKSVIIRTIGMGVQLGFGLLKLAGSIHRVADEPLDPRKDYGRVAGYTEPKVIRSVISGVDTNSEDVHKMGHLSSDAAGGAEVDVFDYPTHGFFLDILEVIAMKFGVITPTVIRYRNHLRKILADNPEKILAIEAHSKGAELAYQAIRLLNDEERGRIHIASYGGARMLPKDLCAYVNNYVCVRDCIPFISDPIGVLLGFLGIGRTIEFLDSKGPYLVDHFFANDVYQKKSKEFNRMINKSQIDFIGSQ